MKIILGEYFDLVRDHMSRLAFPMSFLSKEFQNAEQWQSAARAEVRKLLGYAPPKVPMNPEIYDEYEKDGLLYRHISYAQPYGPRTQGILMKPAGAKGKLPGFLALHDHGGFKYFGKEKITAPRNPPPIMKDYQAEYYGGRAWASELAARGYVVFVPDAFLWGSRKICPEDLPDRYLWQRGFDQPVDSPEYVSAYNDYAAFAESDIAKTFTEAGLTWPGIMLYEDMRAVDFLLTQPEVDIENIGCGGLSGGGLRTVFMGAMDQRIKACCCAGFMSTSEEIALFKVYTHTWMMYLPGLSDLMDFSDLYSLHGNKPTMALYCEDDPLYTKKGQEASNERLTAIYNKMGAPELYEGHFFPGEHKFDVEMQEVAFGFFDKWLFRP